MILFPWQKGKCTEETTGEIAGTRWDGDYIHLYVAYTVDEKEYHLHEQLTYHVVRKKIGKIPIGQRGIPAADRGIRQRDAVIAFQQRIILGLGDFGTDLNAQL